MNYDLPFDKIYITYKGKWLHAIYAIRIHFSCLQQCNSTFELIFRCLTLYLLLNSNLPIYWLFFLYQIQWNDLYYHNILCTCSYQISEEISSWWTMKMIFIQIHLMIFRSGFQFYWFRKMYLKHDRRIKEKSMSKSAIYISYSVWWKTNLFPFSNCLSIFPLAHSQWNLHTEITNDFALISKLFQTKFFF